MYLQGRDRVTRVLRLGLRIVPSSGRMPATDLSAKKEHLSSEDFAETLCEMDCELRELEEEKGIRVICWNGYQLIAEYVASLRECNLLILIPGQAAGITVARNRGNNLARGNYDNSLVFTVITSATSCLYLQSSGKSHRTFKSHH